MKYKGGLVSDMSGSLGGVVASHNKGGTYLRRRVTPTNPKTTGQIARRASFATASVAWRNLSAANQNAWTAYGASLPSPIQGNAMFLRVNSMRALAGLPFISTPPGTGGGSSISPLTIVNVLSDRSVTVSLQAGEAWNATGGWLCISAAPLFSLGATASRSFRTVLTVPCTGALVYNAELPFTVSATQGVKIRLSVGDANGRLGQRDFQPTVDVVEAVPSVLASIVRSDDTHLSYRFNNPVTGTGGPGYFFGRNAAHSLISPATAELDPANTRAIICTFLETLDVVGSGYQANVLMQGPIPYMSVALASADPVAP